MKREGGRRGGGREREGEIEGKGGGGGGEGEGEREGGGREGEKERERENNSINNKHHNVICREEPGYEQTEIELYTCSSPAVRAERWLRHTLPLRRDIPSTPQEHRDIEES